MADIAVEGFYDILKNEAGDILFCIRVRDGEPEHPQIVYSGGEHALFHRRPDQSIVLDHVHPDIRESLLKVKEVLIAEFPPQGDEQMDKEGGIVREYMADILNETPDLPKEFLEGKK